MSNIQEQFEIQLAAIGIEREKLTRKEKYLPLFRLTTFVLFWIFIYNYLIVNDINRVFLAFASLAVFLLLTWRDKLLKEKIERCGHLTEICTNEIKSINGDYSPFEPGDEYIDPDHRYAYDLDLFGKNSLFQCVNRTLTIFGKKRLADYLKNSIDYKDIIKERQSAVSELSAKREFRQQTQLVFFGQKSVEKDRVELIGWLQNEPSGLQTPVFNIVRRFMPVITNILIILAIKGYVIYHVPVMMVILQLLIVSAYAPKTIKAQVNLSSKMGILSKYAQFLYLIEKVRFEAPFLSNLKGRLLHDGNEAPSKIIHQLSQLLNWMDANLNILAAVLLNGLFLFNLQLLAAVEKWRLRYRSDVPQWFEIMAEIDGLSSLANFAGNHPQFIYPELIAEGEFHFEAADLGHPLILQAECVTNSISISGWKQYCIITGANMSGKSTFLRTVGTNYVLAMVGAPVFAHRFIFSPVLLHSSIRTSDSLARKESFFYAELKRLKEIITELESGQHVFILLDEILKGTNSRDKQSGSIALLEQLIKYQSVGLIATHDLVLGDLITSYPDHLINRCFEIQISNGEMVIDYKLLEGVCQNLNATYLMRKMGILIG